MWANQALAYEKLSPTFRALIEPLMAVHELFSKTRNVEDLDQGQVRDMKKSNPRIAQPVVRVHEETGRPALYVSEAVTTQIVGMRKEESDAILEFLFGHQYRWRSPTE
jgi:alpha-ketoglutarate-dependent taurine dioxygenase